MRKLDVTRLLAAYRYMTKLDRSGWAMDEAHIALGVAAVPPLAACAAQIPQISHDPAALHTEPPKPVKAVPMTRLFWLSEC
jgi:hypothetical protein